MTRSSTYRFTTTDRQDPKIKELRAEIKASNLKTPYKQYVKLQGRGYRWGIRDWNKTLPLSYSKRFDVYVYERDPYKFLEDINIEDFWDDEWMLEADDE